jgi:hypothetical protein
MSDSAASRLQIERVLERFPEDAGLIRRLAVESETFQGACEDYALACATLSQLRRLSQEGGHPRMADYQSLVEELEKELSEMIGRAR